MAAPPHPIRRIPFSDAALGIGLVMGAVTIVVSGALIVVGSGAHASHAMSILSVLPGSVCAILAVVVARTFLREVRAAAGERKRQLAALRADSLPERAKHAARVLQEATTLATELQAELDARSIVLEDLKRQAAETAQRTADVEKLAAVDAETAGVMNTYIDRVLKNRLDILERGSQRREWLIGTVVAVASGIIAILFAHFLFGF